MNLEIWKEQVVAPLIKEYREQFGPWEAQAVKNAAQQLPLATKEKIEEQALEYLLFLEATSLVAMTAAGLDVDY